MYCNPGSEPLVSIGSVRSTVPTPQTPSGVLATRLTPDVNVRSVVTMLSQPWAVLNTELYRPLADTVLPSGNLYDVAHVLIFKVNCVDLETLTLAVTVESQLLTVEYTWLYVPDVVTTVPHGSVYVSQADAVKSDCLADATESIKVSVSLQPLVVVEM